MLVNVLLDLSTHRLQLLGHILHERCGVLEILLLLRKHFDLAIDLVNLNLDHFVHVFEVSLFSTNDGHSALERLSLRIVFSESLLECFVEILVDFVFFGEHVVLFLQLGWVLAFLTHLLEGVLN